MVNDNINQSCRAFKILASGPKSLVDSEEPLIMGIIVELQHRQCPEVVDDWPNLLVRTMNRENASDGIVRGICFHNG